MGGDWIKMRAELKSHPKFLSLCSLLIHAPDNPGLLVYVCGAENLGIDAYPPSNENVTELVLRRVTEEALRDVTLSVLLRVWCAVNSHCKMIGSDAFMQPMKLSDVDAIAGFSGFAEAMMEVGWIRDGERKSLIFPNFREYNEPSCLRSTKSNSDRQREFRERKKLQKISSNGCNESNGREEKRREENKKQKATPSACSEAENPPSEPPVLTFPTVGKIKEWHLFSGKISELGAAFPSLDVFAECRKALAWVLADPSRRKTARGMGKFLFAWMSRCADRGPPGRASPAPAGQVRETFRDKMERVKKDMAWPTDTTPGENGTPRHSA